MGLVYTGSFFYPACIICHFLSTSLSHRTWLNRRAACLRAVAQRLWLYSVIDSYQSWWRIRLHNPSDYRRTSVLSLWILELSQRQLRFYVTLFVMPLLDIKFGIWCARSATGILGSIYLTHSYTIFEQRIQFCVLLPEWI